MPGTLWGGLAGALGKAEAISRQQGIQDDEIATKKRDNAIQRAAMLAGLKAQGIDQTAGDPGDTEALGDTGYFRHPSMIQPDYQYMETPAGVVRINKRSGQADPMKDPTGAAIGAPPTKKTVMFDDNGKPVVVDASNPVLPDGFVGKHDAPKVKTANVVNPSSGNVEDVYDDGTHKVIRKATADEIKKAIHVAPDGGPTITVMPGADGKPAQGVITHGPGVGTTMAIPDVVKTAPGQGGAAKGAADKKAKTYVDLMSQSLPTMDALNEKIRPERISFALAHPTLGNMGLNQDEQLYLSAAKNFLAGALHQESGARLSNEQWQIGLQRFFPTAGDTPVTKRAKLNMAKQLLSDRAKEATGAAPAPTAPGATPPAAPASGPFGDLIPKRPEDEE